MLCTVWHGELFGVYYIFEFFLIKGYKFSKRHNILWQKCHEAPQDLIAHGKLLRFYPKQMSIISY